MDTRRLLTGTATLTLLSGCTTLQTAIPLPFRPAAPPTEAFNARVESLPAPADPASGAVGPPEVVLSAQAEGLPSALAEPEPSGADRAAAAVGLSGRRAIAAANSAARTASVSDAFVGGVQVFAWSPGRVFEVWTAPLRVTTLTLGPGEALVTKAAGDTVRWQIGEAVSGEGGARRVHVMLKPLERGLETNLVLTTNRRVYLIELRSGGTDAFNAAVAWDDPDPGLLGPEPVAAPLTEPAVATPIVAPDGPLDGRYRIEPRGRRPRWTPTSVFNDGRRTFITFDPDMQVDEAPALFVLSPDGENQMVNYRQIGGLFVVDRVFDQAELRLGDRRPQVVRLRRLTGGRP
jgi:P-type conjugative transfer protein TrbG